MIGSTQRDWSLRKIKGQRNAIQCETAIDHKPGNTDGVYIPDSHVSGRGSLSSIHLDTSTLGLFQAEARPKPVILMTITERDVNTANYLATAL